VGYPRATMRSDTDSIRADVTMRPAVAGDLAAIHALQRRIETHDRLPLATPLAEFEDWLTDPDLDLARDTRVVESGGALVAWGRIWHHPSRGRQARAYLFGGVAPERRRQGVGSTLLSWELERAAELLRTTSPDVPRYVRAQVYDFQSDVRRLYERHGLATVRWIDELLRPLDAPGPALPATPGVAILPFDRARSADARHVINASFADHWGFTPIEPAAWEHQLESAGMRLDLSFLALDGDRAVGYCRNATFPEDEAVVGRRDGWIFQLGVVREHRKRGIASALVAASLDAFRGAGLTHGALAVDSENPTGAYGLYQRLGFAPMRRSVVYEITA
jgi:mycothiol synthase